MASYTYDNVTISNLSIASVRIARAVGVSPTGLSDSGSITTVHFAASLTAEQKTLLDTFMAGSDLDVIPTTTNTVYTIDDVAALKASIGLDFDIYPTSNGGVTVVFQKTLSASEKNSVKNAFAALLK